MTTPAKFSGVSSSVTIDGTDMHTYGLIVNSVSNPPPAPRKSTTEVSGLDGDFDFTKNYGPRSMTLDCSIIADTNAQLLTNIDALKAFIGLKENGASMLLVFQNQTDRYWTVKYDGGLDIKYNQLWKLAKTAKCTVQFKCVKPYAEKTAVTTATALMTVRQNKVITYAGTIPAPLSVEITPDIRTNILEQIGGDCNEDNALWMLDNCTGSNDTTFSPKFGAASIRIAPVAAGTYIAKIDVSAGMSASKNYICGVYARVSTAGSTHGYFSMATDGAVGTKSVAIDSNGVATLHLMKLSAAELAGATVIEFRVTGTTEIDYIWFDGGFIYEITAAECADSSFVTLPYISDPAGDDAVPLVDPKLRLHRNINLAKFCDGVDSTEWTTSVAGASKASISVVPDPLVPGKKCFALVLSRTGDISSVFSPKIYFQGAKPAHVQYDYYLKHLGAGIADITLLEKSEGNSSSTYINESDVVSVAAVGSAWATRQIKITTSAATDYLQLWIHPNSINTNFVLYLKNVIVTMPAGVNDAYATFIKSDIKEQTISGTYDLNDKIIMDNDLLICQKYDDSAKTIANNMANFSGDRLLLAPGANVLRLLDSRDSAQYPERTSCGAAQAIISYRERYL